MARSTSSTKIFSPPELTVTESRPEQLDLPVGPVPGPVAGDGVADAVDHGEGARRLVRVAEIPERHVPGLGQPAVALVARLEHPRQRLVDHQGARSGEERPHLDVVHGRDVHLRPGLRRAGRVGDDEVGDALDRHGPHGRGERRAAVADGEERGEVVALLVELHQQRAQHGVAHDGHGVRLLACRRSIHTSSGSTRRVSSGKMSVAPWAMSMKQAHCAAPCMSGGRMSSRTG